jgi:leucine dehydrogenase
MNLYSAPDFDDHEEVHFFHDSASGLKAIIALHYTGPGRGGGGIRMWPYASDEEALRDVLRLSKAMSYKMVLADIPIGGGKSVIIGDSARDKTPELMRAMGRAIESLGGRYVCGEDVGTTPDDMALIRQETRWVVGLEDVSGDTSPPTAYGVYLGLRAAAEHKLGAERMEGLRVAVQGVGAVGLDLCRRSWSRTSTGAPPSAPWTSWGRRRWRPRTSTTRRWPSSRPAPWARSSTTIP